MSFPSTFGTQVAAIMEVLTKSAVAEITKLVEDESVVLHMEIRRRDTAIQELKRSLMLIEAELYKAQEAATTRVTTEQQMQTTNDELMVKDEPVVEVTSMETTTYNNNTVKEEEEGLDDSVCPDPFSMMEKNSAAVQILLPRVEHYYSANTDGSLSTEQVTDVSLNVPVKVEMEIPSIFTQSSSTPDPLNQDQFQPGPSKALPRVRKPKITKDQSHSRNNFKAKKPVRVWKINPRLFPCSMCKESFVHASQLEQHMVSIHQPFSLRSYRCLECGKFFTQKTRLKTHQSVHTGEKPYSCKICGKMFSRRDNCLRHERFHSGKRPHSCRQCGKTFTVLWSLKIHEETHLQGR